MREEAFGFVQPLDLAGTYRMATMRVPAPMREETNGSAQPLNSAWTNVRKLPMATLTVVEEFTDCVPVAVR